MAYAHARAGTAVIVTNPGATPTVTTLSFTPTARNPSENDPVHEEEKQAPGEIQILPLVPQVLRPLDEPAVEDHRQADDEREAHELQGHLEDQVGLGAEDVDVEVLQDVHIQGDDRRPDAEGDEPREHQDVHHAREAAAGDLRLEDGNRD